MVLRLITAIYNSKTQNMPCKKSEKWNTPNPTLEQTLEKTRHGPFLGKSSYNGNPEPKKAIKLKYSTPKPSQRNRGPVPPAQLNDKRPHLVGAVAAWSGALARITTLNPKPQTLKPKP